MVELGTAHGVTTVALLTDMSTPLGLAVGNAIEVEESLEVLAGGGPADVVELTLALAREMLAAAGLRDADPADGAARRPGDGLLAGDDPGAGRRPGRAAAAGAGGRGTSAPTGDGFVSAVDAYAIGVAAWRLGAGRARKEDPVSASAGVMLHKQAGRRGARRRRALRAACRRRRPDPGRGTRRRVGGRRSRTRRPTAAPLILERLV